MQRYTLLRINSIGTLASKFFVEKNLYDKSYDEQLEVLKTNNFIHPGSWSKLLNKLDINSFDIIPNFEPFQNKWKDTFYPNENLNYIETIYKQIEHYKPDVIFIYAYAFIDSFPRFMRNDIKKKFPFVKIITGLWGDHLLGSSYRENFSDLDFIFTNCIPLKEEFEKRGLKAFHLGNAFDPYVISDFKNYNKKSFKKKYDSIFSGESGYNKFDHIERFHFLKFLMHNTNLTVFAEEHETNKSIYSKFKNLNRINIIKILGKISETNLKKIMNMSDNFKFKRILNEAILSKKDNLFLKDNFKNEKSLKNLYPDRVNSLAYSIKDYYDNIKFSKITINIHREDPTDIGNIRVFEVTGLNSFLLTDKAEELKDYFEEGKHFIGYKNANDCVDKMNYFLKNEKERIEISNFASEHCLRYHTVKNRCEFVDEILSKQL